MTSCGKNDDGDRMTMMTTAMMTSKYSDVKRENENEQVNTDTRYNFFRF